jgi:hypothetical protein
MLASRLKDMERDGLAARRRLPPPGAAYVYELTPRGRALLPVLQAREEWGQEELGEPRPTDALRAHWFALPLLRALREAGAGEGIVEVRLEEGVFHLYAGEGHQPENGPVYGDGPAPRAADAVLALDSATCTALARGELDLAEAVRDGRADVTGDGVPAKALRQA